MRELRIKTRIGNDRVYTLYSLSNWVTIVHINGKSSSITASSLSEAGQNHLQSCLKVKGLQGGTGRNAGDMSIGQSSTDENKGS